MPGLSTDIGTQRYVIVCVPACHLINTSTVAKVDIYHAFHFHQATRIEFVLELQKVLLSHADQLPYNQKKKKRVPKTRSTATKPHGLSLDQMHFPIVADKKSRCHGCRIANPNFTTKQISETQKRCDTCKDEQGNPVPLCVAKGKNCFRVYHEKHLFGMHS